MRSYKEGNETLSIIRRRLDFLKSHEAHNEILKQLTNQCPSFPMRNKLLSIITKGAIEVLVKEYDSFIIPLIEGYGDK